MRTNFARRQAIMDFVRRNGGKATSRETHDALLKAGLPCDIRTVIHHLRTLAAEGQLVPTGIGHYWQPQMLAARPERIVARLPHGTNLKGHILYALLVEGITRTGVLKDHLMGCGVLRTRSALAAALTELKREDLIDRPGYGVITASAAAYASIGMDQPAADHAVDLHPITRLQAPLMAHLKAHGPTRICVLARTFGDQNQTTKQNLVYARHALETLRENGYVKKVSRGVYDATEKPYPDAAVQAASVQ